MSAQIILSNELPLMMYLNSIQTLLKKKLITPVFIGLQHYFMHKNDQKSAQTRVLGLSRPSFWRTACAQQGRAAGDSWQAG
ncbi:MAG: hypothetical protein WBK51_01625 [Polaromonas sp.]